MGKPKNKPLIELDSRDIKKAKVIHYWDSGKEAAEFYRFNPVYISMYLNGTQKSCRGKFFRYATPAEIEVFRNIDHQITTSEKLAAEPVEQPAILPGLPVELIPEIVEKPVIDCENLSPFERMLKEKAEKLKNNS